MFTLFSRDLLLLDTEAVKTRQENQSKLDLKEWKIPHL